MSLEPSASRVEHARVLGAAILAAWLIGLADALMVLTASAGGEGARGYGLGAARTALTYATLIGAGYGLLAAGLLCARARLAARGGLWRRASAALRPAGVLSLLWVAVAIDLVSGPGISASPWRVPVLFAFVAVGGGGLAASSLAFRAALRRRSRPLRAALVTALLAGAGVAYATGFLYPNSYQTAHAYGLLLALVAAHAGVFVVIRPRRPRRWLALCAVAAAGATALAVAFPLAGAPRALAFRHAQLVRQTLLQAARLTGPDRARELPAQIASDRDFGAGALPPCDGRPERAHDVILISVDALRADRLSVTSPERAVIPNLDRMGEQGLVVTRGYAPSPATSTSLIPLLSGTSALALRETGRVSSTLASELKRLGYETHTFVDLAISRRAFPEVTPKRVGFTRQHKQKNAAKFADRLIELIESDRSAPLFAYVHLVEPHAPYQRRGKFDFGGGMIDRYDSEVAYADHHIGRVFDAVIRAGRGDRTVIAVTADHGEAFYEHDLMGHARSLYEEMVRVPILILGPGIEPAVIEAPTSALDVAPTLMAAIGCGWTTAQEGKPLWAEGELREPSSPIAVYQYNEHERGARFVRRVATIVGDEKLIEDRATGVEELYDLARDPGERENLISDRPERAEALRAANLEVRERMAWVARQNTAGAVSGLVARVKHGSLGAIEEAFDRIVARPGEPAAIALVAALRESPEEESSAVLEALLSRRDLPPPLLRRAARALAHRGPPSGRFWEELAGSDRAPDTARAEAIAILAESGAARARQTLGDLLSPETPDPVAAAAAAALCRAPEPPADLSARVRRRFPSPDSLDGLRVEVVRALLGCVGRAPDDDDTDYLMQVFADRSLVKRKKSVYIVIDALGRAGSDRPLPLLKELSRERYDPIRIRATRAIVALETEAAGAYLATLAERQRHLELDTRAFQAALARAARRRVALPAESLPERLGSGGIDAPGEALRDAIAEARESGGGGEALLVLHVRRDPSARGGGPIRLSFGDRRAAEAPVGSFDDEEPKPLYLALPEGALSSVNVTYPDGEPPFELTAAELLWIP